MIILSEIRQQFGYMRNLEDLEAYWKGIQERPMTTRQREILEEIYLRRKFKLEHPELPKRDKR
jgi:hypothetical protein